MDRRNFINTTSLAGIGLTFSSFSSLTEREKIKNLRGTFSQNDNKISIYVNAQVEPMRIFHITDTHLSLDDERGLKYQEYSKRMAGAYKSNTHFQTGEKYSTKESFENTLSLAKKQEVDFLALTGDIFSFPSEAAVDWAFKKLNETKIPFAYVAGNHDWHYEGMKGTRQELRNIWTEKHLKSMYQGNHPLYAAYNFKGVRFICIDNSTYEILPEQLKFFKEQSKHNVPMILLMHIPMYMPGRSMGFGCANPNWGAQSDKNYKLEGREKWREGGHTKITMDFYDEIFSAQNLVSILAGHTHRPTLDIKNEVPQIVSAHNATGYYSDIQIDSFL